MKRLIPLAVVFAVAGLAPAADLKELAGTYKVLAMKQDGTDAPAGALADVKGVTITADGTFTVELMKDKKTATLKVDDKAKPATIDFSPQDGPEKGKTFPGIFTFEKGKLTIAMTETATRPTDFKGGKDQMVIVLEKDVKK